MKVLVQPRVRHAASQIRLVCEHVGAGCKVQVRRLLLLFVGAHHCIAGVSEGRSGGLRQCCSRYIQNDFRPHERRHAKHTHAAHNLLCS